MILENNGSQDIKAFRSSAYDVGAFYMGFRQHVLSKNLVFV